MLARHEETRAMRFDNTKSLAFGLRTLLAVALHQYVQEHVDSDRQSCLYQNEWQAWENRPRDAIASYVFQGKNWPK